jgi:hypothetical protein
VLDGIRVVRTGHFKDLLKVVLGWSGAPLEIAFGCRHALFVRVLDLLIVIVGHRSEAMRAMLLSLLPTFSTLFGASDGGTSGCGPATGTCVNQSEGDPNSLLT